MKLFKKIFALLTLMVTFVSAEFSTYEEAFTALNSKWDEIVENLNKWVYEIWRAETILKTAYDKWWYSEFEDYWIEAIYEKIKTKLGKLETGRNTIDQKYAALYSGLQVTDKSYYTIANDEAHKQLKETYQEVIKKYPYFSWALTVYYKKLDNDLDYATAIWWKAPEYTTGDTDTQTTDSWTGTNLERAQIKWDNVLLQLDKDWDYKQAKYNLREAFTIVRADVDMKQQFEDEYYKYKRKLDVFLELTGSFDSKAKQVFYKVSIWKLTKQWWVQELKTLYTDFLSGYSQFPKTCERIYSQYSIKLQNLNITDSTAADVSMQNKLDNTALNFFVALNKKYKKSPVRYKNVLNNLVSKLSAEKYKSSNPIQYIVQRFKTESKYSDNYKQYISNGLKWYFSLNWWTKNKAGWYYKMKVNNIQYASGVISKWLILSGINSGLKIYKGISESKNEYYSWPMYSEDTSSSSSSSTNGMKSRVSNSLSWYTIYYNKPYNISIKHPKDWLNATKYEESLYTWAGSLLYAAVRLKQWQTEEGFRKNYIELSLSALDLSSQSSMTLDEYEKLFEDYIKNGKKWEILSTDKITIDGQAANKIKYNFSDAWTWLQWIQAQVIKNDKVYVITFVTFSKYWDSFSSQIDQVLNSFKFDTQSSTSDDTIITDENMSVEKTVKDTTYYNEEYKLSFTHPDDWLVWASESEEQATSNASKEFYTVAKIDPSISEEDMRNNYISLHALVMEDKYWLDMESYKEQFETSVKDILKWEVVESKMLTVDGLTGFKIVYTYSSSKGYNYKAADFRTINDWKIFILSFITVPQWYDNFSTKIDEVINSLKFDNHSWATVQSLKIMEEAATTETTATEASTGDALSWDALTWTTTTWDTVNFDKSASISLWFWMNISDLSTGNKILTVHKWTNATEVFTLFLNTDGTLSINMDDASHSSIKWTTVIQPNTWYHIWLIYDPEENLIKVYINGANDIYSVIADLNIDNPIISMWNYFEWATESLNTTLNIDEVYFYTSAIDVDTLQMIYRKK